MKNVFFYGNNHGLNLIGNNSFTERFLQEEFPIKFSDISCFQISIRSSWANREITMEIRTSNVPCSDMRVVWRMTWEDVAHGRYERTQVKLSSNIQPMLIL